MPVTRLRRGVAVFVCNIRTESVPGEGPIRCYDGERHKAEVSDTSGLGERRKLSSIAPGAPEGGQLGVTKMGESSTAGAHRTAGLLSRRLAAPWPQRAQIFRNVQAAP